MGAVVASAVWITGGVAQASPGRSNVGRAHRMVCATAANGFARCHADVVTDATGTPLTTTAPAGYGPDELRAAYELTANPTTAGTGQTVAIIDAYDDPNAQPDLGVYRRQYGLSPCTTANGCFAKVNQRGGTAYPSPNASWAQETSLDLDMASAVCPACRILLVEADSNSIDDLGAAVDQAARLGASQISNSYGSDEYPRETLAEAHYNHPGIGITASSGDSGYGVQFPAASRYVTAVGGTRLVRDATAPGGWTETAWSGASSGCSAYIPKPAWQHDQACAQRSVADVAAVADPDTGVAVYDSVADQGSAGWMMFGGTSVSAPIVAAFDALTGAAGSPSYAYAHSGSYVDIVAGANGVCTWAYLCTAGPGFDGPTGLGSIDGAPPAALPTATTAAANVITDSAATVTAMINANGTSTAARFLYGPTTGYGFASPQHPVNSDAVDHAISAPLSGLAPATTYHYRLVATIDCNCRNNTSYGSDATFTTTSAPLPAAAPLSDTFATTSDPASDLTTNPPPELLPLATPASTSASAAPASTDITIPVARRPAKLKILHATISRGRLHASATITRLAASGPMHISFHAHHHTSHFIAVAYQGRLRFTHKLPILQQHTSDGIVTITYAGDPRVAPGHARASAELLS